MIDKQVDSSPYPDWLDVTGIPHMFFLLFKASRAVFL